MYDPVYGIRLKCSVRTDTGKVRDNNEDSVGVHDYGDNTILVVVADGMGGAVAGEEASRIAVETIKTDMTAPDKQPPDGDYNSADQDGLIQRLRSSIIDANNNIVNRAVDKPELKGMGTTVTMALIFGTNILVGHVGDSRAYLVDGTDGDMTQITSDHSFVQALVAAGHITEDEADDHPMKNVLYRALGQSREVEVDISIEQIHIGDRLVLCSDGLTLHVKPHEIAKLAMRDDPAECSRELIALANERGGRDNISVIVVKAEINSGGMPSLFIEEETAISSRAEKTRPSKPVDLPKGDDEPKSDELTSNGLFQSSSPQYHQTKCPDPSSHFRALSTNNQSVCGLSADLSGEGQDHIPSD
jgi:PPM family protein phosphatase